MKLLKFQATWCQPCKMLSRTMQEAADKITIPVEEIDIDQNMDMAVQFQVRGVPTLVVVDDEGKELKRMTGMVNETKLMEFLSV